MTEESRIEIEREEKITELVAIAIRNVVTRNRGDSKPWDKIPAKQRDAYRAEAVAAIDAYRKADGSSAFSHLAGLSI